MIEVAEEADADESEEDEPPERLYTTLNTSVVGIQYYKGYTPGALGRAPHADTLGRSRRVWGTGETRSGTKQSI